MEWRDKLVFTFQIVIKYNASCLLMFLQQKKKNINSSSRKTRLKLHSSQEPAFIFCFNIICMKTEHDYYTNVIWWRAHSFTSYFIVCSHCNCLCIGFRMQVFYWNFRIWIPCVLYSLNNQNYCVIIIIIKNSLAFLMPCVVILRTQIFFVKSTTMLKTTLQSSIEYHTPIVCRWWEIF